MRVLTVLRGGGEYGPQHVRWLRDQIRERTPSAKFCCLSDQPVKTVDTLPLMFGWPGWWSKMELFRPDIEGDFLYMDLDTLVCGDISDFLERPYLTVLRDFYRPEGLQSSLMKIPEDERLEIWRDFNSRPSYWMSQYRQEGDQGYLERFWLNKATRWQDVLPRQVLSYKVDLVGRRQEEPPAGTRIVIFHGTPRPWAASSKWVSQFYRLHR